MRELRWADELDILVGEVQRRLDKGPQVGQDFAVTRERVRQIESRAFEKVKRAAMRYFKSEDSPGLEPTQLELVG